MKYADTKDVNLIVLAFVFFFNKVVYLKNENVGISNSKNPPKLKLNSGDRKLRHYDFD